MNRRDQRRKRKKIKQRAEQAQKEGVVRARQRQEQVLIQMAAEPANDKPETPKQ